MKKTERLIYQNSNQEKIEISFYSVYMPLSFAEDLDNDMTSSPAKHSPELEAVIIKEHGL